MEKLVEIRDVSHMTDDEQSDVRNREIGQQQRVAMARAIAQTPPIFLGR